MAISWDFKKPQPGDKNREPVLGEFFATEAISNAAEALVREGIQNALDAALNGGDVSVRIYVSGSKGALASDAAQRHFTGIWPHVGADGNGLHEPPASRENCAFLTFEDFGTSGLVGDPEQWHNYAGVKKPVLLFFPRRGPVRKRRTRSWSMGCRQNRLSPFK